MKTLPMLAREWGESLDALREVVRNAPDLKGIGTFLGSQRVFSVEESKRIKNAGAPRTQRARRKG